MKSVNSAAPLVQEADKLLACIHCGFCLSSCPTYTRLGVETDSPRGRLDLMRAVVEGRLDPGADGFTVHIDQCLGCRACETACPAGVEYGFLLERARESIGRARGHRMATRVLLAVFGSRLLSGLAGSAGRVLLGTGLVHWLLSHAPARPAMLRFGLAMLAATRGWPGLREHRGPAKPATVRATGAEAARTTASAPSEHHVADHPAESPGVVTGSAAAIPEDQTSKTVILPERASAGGESTARTAMLDGCVQRGLFARVNRATERVLAANGATLVQAPGQGCCGALHAHAGELDRARELAQRNIEAFERSGAEIIAVNAAGCGAALKGYADLLKDNADWHARAEAFATRVRDVFEILDGQPLRQGAALHVRAAYDAPCHLYHAQRVTRAPLDVLSSIPGLEATPVADFEDCCGGAGIYGLEHPDLGGRIVRDKLAACRAAGADVVVTPNPGCIMQIGAGFLLEGEAMPVIHPLELIDESYRRGGLYE